MEYNKNINIEIFNDFDNLSIKLLDNIKPGNIGLSGGSTYLKLLKIWGEKSINLSDLNFYPVDERVVYFNSKDSNWGNTYRNFLSKYNKDRNHHFTSSEEYNEKLKNIHFTTIYLGIGDDGHTASLFNTEDVFRYQDKKAISTISPKPPYNRISLTGNYIIEADNIIIILYGKGKKEITESILNKDDLPITTLLSRVKNGTIYIHNELIGDSNE